MGVTSSKMNPRRVGDSKLDPEGEFVSNEEATRRSQDLVNEDNNVRETRNRKVTEERCPSETGEFGDLEISATTSRVTEYTPRAARNATSIISSSRNDNHRKKSKTGNGISMGLHLLPPNSLDSR
eukprot:CAMPEP_0194588910 /NCGR_PEP_ID=MMETSP0292-20121207/20178_1 /TAXON_ID=39354 /ORGANISM="Heterosigma akashiwo, Strain CCMP2393" /LENGTH=124 /DNA_ID=CAMNT_0039445737 /DNA_START=11 /DNA_END=381 /DNA_ORIENTATION=+